jgi:hypothetical protein
LDIPELSEAASVAPVFPAMANNSLLSVRKLCNEVYSAIFEIYGIAIFNSIGKERTQRFGHRIVAHQLAQIDSTQTHSRSK